MSSGHHRRWWLGAGAVAASLLAVLAAGWTTRAEEPAGTAKGGDRVRDVLSALRELQAAVDREDSSASGSKKEAAGLPARPARTVTPPTLDAEGLDALLEKVLAEAKTPHATTTTDEEFVRRVCLDVTGKLPTPDQVREFVRSKAKDKRAKLINYLLDGPEYATNWARYWRDAIRFGATNQNARQIGYDGLEKWLAERFRKNTPWDEVVRGLITATGRTDENGAVALELAQEAKPVELAGEVSRLFLGVQIQCAQCHDHPSDTWKRQQFHEFASFFAGTRARNAARGAGQAKGKAQGPPVFEVVAQGKPRYTMPDLKDPQKQVPVAPRFFLASAGETVPNGLDARARRELAASYITGQDNPWFAKSFVNRAWYVLMGEGFYNPVDDLGPARTANAPEVIDTLAAQWQKGGYDVKWLFRTILNTKVYQRQARASNTAAGRTPFAANCPTRLRSDQILDALAQALDLDLDTPGRGGGPAAAKKAQGKGAAAKKAVLAAGFQNAAAGKGRLGNNPRILFNTVFGVDPSTPNDEVLGTIPQALFLMNSPLLNRAIRASDNTRLGAILASTADNRAALEALYLRVLARRPNAKEVQVCGRYLDAVGDRREAFEDILWSLVNSTEFLSRR